MASKAVAVAAPAARFLRSARLCRARDLEQLSILVELLKSISLLIHALQTERGASSIVLGSHGAQFTERLVAQVAQSRALEASVRERLEHIDEKLDRMSSGARFYTCVAFAFRALDTLPRAREQICVLALAPQDAIKAFTDIICCLLAVGFEVADMAADPVISRALVALVNFAQGKEYAGQERATAGAAFSRGQFHAADQSRLRQLISAQDQAFRVFAQFCEPAHVTAFHSVMATHDGAEVKRMRRTALARERIEGHAGIAADTWFEHTTRRIDDMKAIEDAMTAELGRLCADQLAQSLADAEGSKLHGADFMVEELAVNPRIAMLVTDAGPAVNSLGLEGGAGLYTVDAVLPKPMHSILDVIRAQSRRIDDVSQQLESARVELAERKVIERAKGLLMKNRRLSEAQAYALMRQTAMQQNKRIFEIAEALVSMADIL